jgi:hypothetical protein
MNILYGLLILFFSISSWAEFIHSRIYELEVLPEYSEALIKFENGEVGFIKLSDKLFSKILKANDEKKKLKIYLDGKRTIQNFETIPSRRSEYIMPDISIENNEYQPTVLNSLTDAFFVLKTMRRDWQYSSQCYNRAHIWAFEAFELSKLKSIKLFMFFTSKYIREYRFKWWFHVSPMTYVRSHDQIRPVVLDRKFSAKPLSPKSWSDLFIYSGKECPVIKRYSEYENHQRSEDCYHIPVSMYFWQPRDIKKFEESGYQKESFFKSEIDWAYEEAF